ncbi:hypothetical protein FR943_21260 [Mycobacterium sp. TNTM28]|uniref:DUF222 domain-containing protein n=1 Tax=[Mycobacterium] fortunisiensis TaxID=2600579 RepID=A0ABS6KS72_9MYCO|nr:hypothetical protein [[Mycobacterium] fortunisiensis]MBU9766359.1 hypothetical protein [[Mycobacterium] fortunisiensis]
MKAVQVAARSPHPIAGHLRRGLARLVESEELGESFALAAASHARDEHQAHAWRVIHALEAQTNGATRKFLQHSGIDVSETNRLAAAAGRIAAPPSVYWPWKVQLHSLRLATRRYLPVFQGLADGFHGTPHQDFFEYVVDHEVAIIRFIERDLDGQPAPLDAMLRLLETPVPMVEQP